MPNYEKAYVPKHKLSNYLLSGTHAVGKAKARYSRSPGDTVAVVALISEDMRLMQDKEILHVRKLQAA